MHSTPCTHGHEVLRLSCRELGQLRLHGEGSVPASCAAALGTMSRCCLALVAPGRATCGSMGPALVVGRGAAGEQRPSVPGVNN